MSAAQYSQHRADSAVRRYHPADRVQLFRIAADTAFFGEPLEAYLEDRRLFLNLFYRYYTDMEPERCWVAEADGQLAGFLTGCLDTRTRDRWLLRQLPSALGGIISRRYHIRERTGRYALRMLAGWLRGEFPAVDLRGYPAHLHINLDRGWRGYGFGHRLMVAYLDQLHGLGAIGVHLHTTSYNLAACALYEKMGFQLLGERDTGVWKGLISERITNRVYGKRLG